MKLNVKNQHISVLIVVLLLLTAGNYEIIKHEVTQSIPMENFLVQEISSDADQEERSVSSTKEVHRKPSSIQNRGKLVLNSGNYYEFGCKNQRTPQSVETKRFVSKNQLFLLRGKACLKENGFSLKLIRNQTNGFTASIFERKQSEFQTDFIQLNKGENQMLLEFQNSEGQKKTETIFVRFDS